MNVKTNNDLTRVNISRTHEVKIQRKKEDKSIEVKRERRKIEDIKFNEMQIREKQIRNQSEAKEKIKEVTRSIRESKDALRTMDRIDEVRDKVLTTLS